MALLETCSAAMGTTVATLAFYPVDLVKTRYQAQVGTGDGAKTLSTTGLALQIIEQEGLLGLYQGLAPYLMKDIINVGSLFFWKYLVTNLYTQYTKRSPRIVEGLLLGMIGGSINQCLMLPTDRIMVRLQVDAGKPTVPQVIQSIYSEEGGIGGFWSGLAPSLMLTSNPAVTFTAFDFLKQRVSPLLGKTEATLSVLQSFIMASIAKGLALCLTYPLIRAKVVMLGRLKRATAAGSNSAPAGPRRGKKKPGVAQMLATLSEILTKEGSTGLYKGFAAQFWLSILSSGMLLMVMDKIKAIVKRSLSRVALA